MSQRRWWLCSTMKMCTWNKINTVVYFWLNVVGSDLFFLAREPVALILFDPIWQLLRWQRRSLVSGIWHACCLEPLQCSSSAPSPLAPGSCMTQREEDTPGNNFPLFLFLYWISLSGSLQKKTRRRRRSSLKFMQNPSSLKIYKATARFHRDYIST